MEEVVLVIHLMLALALIGLVLIQRSEGGGLGIGGGGGGLGQFASVRSTANVLTRATAFCATGFFITSLTLAYMAGSHSSQEGILESSGLNTIQVKSTIDGDELPDMVEEAVKDVEETAPDESPSAPISE